MYNRHILEMVEEGLPYEDYIFTHEKPFADLRISIITISGAVVYDNMLSVDSLDNHRLRPEISSAVPAAKESGIFALVPMTSLSAFNWNTPLVVS